MKNKYLTIEKETLATGRVECSYKNKLKTALLTDESLSQFDMSARVLMGAVNTGNHIQMSDLYCVELNRDNVSIWHLNNKGGKDRLVMRVTEV